MWYQNFNESINNIIEVCMLIYKVRTEFFWKSILIINILQTVIIMFAVLNIARLQTHLMRSLARDDRSDL